MFLSNLSIKKPILVSMFLLVFVLFGLLAYFALPISLFPDLKIPYVFIQTVYPGAGPLVIETQVTKKIEDEISAIGQLKTVTSYSMEGVSFIQLEFKIGKDENVAVQEVKDKVDLILNDLPKDAKKPAVSKADINSWAPVMSIVVEGKMEATELYTAADTVVKERIAQVEGVGSVDIVGGRQREIRVEFDKRTVFENTISLAQMTGILQAANLEMPGGNFKQEGQDVSVRLKGEFSSVEDIRNLDVPTAAGMKKFRQIASVKDTSKEVRQRTLFLDRASKEGAVEVLLLQVIKNPSGNTVKIVKEVTKRMPQIERELGGTVKLKTVSEDATFVQASVDDTMNNIILGVLLTGLTLLFFLHDLRSTLIVALAMPFSIIATFMVMQAMDISFNIMSLMGLSTSTGILVANSVVVLENIFRHKELGHGRADAAGKGTAEVVIAVLASTLTNIAVFLPLGNMGGFMGIILKNFAYTVVIATIFSILVSFTLTPMMASRILPDTVKKELWISRRLEAVFKSWEVAYKKILVYLLKGRKRSGIVLLVTLAVFAASMLLAPMLQMEFIPNSDGGKISINIELPQGFDLDATSRKVVEIQDIVKRREDVEIIITTLGQTSALDQEVSLAKMDITLVNKAKRAKRHTDVAAEMTRDLSKVTNATLRISAVSEAGGGDAPINFHLRGTDIDKLQDYGVKIKRSLDKIPGLMNVNMSTRPGKPEITLAPNRKRVSEEGITINDLAVALRAAIEGIVATTYKERGNEYDIRVVLKDESLKTYEDLKNIPIATPNGIHPVSYFADIEFTESFNKILHTDKNKTVEFTAYLLPGYVQGDMLKPIEDEVKKLGLPEGYYMKWAGDTEAFQEMVRDFLVVFFLSVILTYMLLAASLESLVQPLFILGTIPMSFVGVILACVGTGTTMNFLSMLSVVMLVGIVVNNAILILDYANQLRAGGMDTREAMIEACPVKLKPILMSNLAMILGMLPMAIGSNTAGAEMRQPMGIVSIGGILSSTLLTLLVIPALEVFLSRHKHKKGAPA